MLSKEYIAGYFDGEGHISITWTGRPNRTSLDPKLSVSVCNTHLPSILEIQKQYGRSIHRPIPTKEHYLQVHRLSFSVKESKAFLIDMLPLLVIKKRQAEVALKFSLTIYARGKKRVTKEEKEIREDCMYKLKMLKKEEW